METFGWKQADCYEDLIDLHYFFSLSVKLAFDVFFMIQETGVLLIILEKSSIYLMWMLSSIIPD